jgi:ATP-dependent Clp protease ATP-binding subunit ClpC
MSEDLKKLTDWSKLEELIKKAENGETFKIDQDSFEKFCFERVLGQDSIIKDVVKLIRLEYVKSKRQRPIANLLFLGPTGTGKTELAKSIAAYLFGDEESMLRFDCSEFSGSHSKDRLIGMPTGYVGAEQGGQLTRPVLLNNKRVILFDEIEKAHKGVFDLFLQLMGEGRLTEQGSGKVADFSNCIIILTSNAIAEEMSRLKKQFTDHIELANALKSQLVDNKVFRPEIMGRVDRVCIFDALQGDVVAHIVLLKIKKLAHDYNLALNSVAAESIFEILQKNKKISRFGVRELERIIFDVFAEDFANLKSRGASGCTIEVNPDGEIRVLGN